MADLYDELVADSRYLDAFKNVTIYGVAGTNGSGKDTVLDVLGELDFYTFNNGDALRKISLLALGSTGRGSNDAPAPRIANVQRARYPGGMVELGLLQYWIQVLHLPPELQPAGLATGSIRGVNEAKRLKQLGGKLIVTDADPLVRYERFKNRGRYYEKSISFEQFQAEELGEMGTPESDPTKLGMAEVISMGDITITNDSSDIEAFKQQVRERLGL